MRLPDCCFVFSLFASADATFAFSLSLCRHYADLMAITFTLIVFAAARCLHALFADDIDAIVTLRYAALMLPYADTLISPPLRC